MPTVPDIEGYSELIWVARGGFGSVYRGRQDRHGRDVAIKVLDVDDLDRRARERFDRECRAMGSLSWHPNVVALLDSGVTEEGRPYLTMDFVEGGTFADRVVDAPLPWAEAVAVAVKVAGALDVAHGAGILHRDLKPENLLVGPYGEVLLGDFGIAALEGAGRTTAGNAAFTVDHVAPEVLQGQRPDERSDVYGLGSTLYTLVAGEPPFSVDAGTPIAAKLQQVIGRPAPRLTGVPDDLADVVSRALEKDPQRRPASAAELGRALQAVQAAHGLPVTDLRDAGSTAADGSRPPPAPAPPTDDGLDAPRPPVDDRGDVDDRSTISIERPAAVPVPGRRRPRRWLVVAAAAVLVAALAAVLVARTGGDDGETAGDATTPPAEDGQGRPRVAATVDVDAQPDGVALTSDAAWVSSRGDGTVTRIALADNEPVTSIAAGGAPGGVAATESAVWVPNALDDTVSRIDPASNQVVATIDVGSSPGAVAATDSAVWVTNSSDGTVSRINPASDRVVATVEVGPYPASVAATDDAVWVADFEASTVSRIDPVSNRVVATINVGTTPFSVAATDDAVWVANNDSGTVSRIDAATNSVVATIEVGNGPGGIAAADEDVWVSNIGDDNVMRLDPGSNTVVATVPVGRIPVAVAVSPTAVWTADNGDDTATRIDPSGG